MNDRPFWSSTDVHGSAARLGSLLHRTATLLPGLTLCGSVSVVASGLQAIEDRLFGRAWLEGLVLAILLGTIVRTLWCPPSSSKEGIAFAAKRLLEVAVMLLGASLTFGILASVGPGLILGVAAVVALAIPTSFLIGRMLGLPKRLAMLVACGNSICGNSAIAAVAPTIGARSEDITASIAFTAVLGVAVVLGLPFLALALRLNDLQFGALSGLTVYATPQVLAAAASGGPVATQVGTFVKLIRVLMLGPVVLVLSLLSRRFRDAEEGEQDTSTERRAIAVHRLVPWFVVAFLALATLRSLDLIPLAAVTPIATLANLLTILSMAALGLGVDVRVVARAGARVTAAATLSLTALGGVSLGLIHLLGI